MKLQPKSSSKVQRPLILADIAARAGVAVSTVSRVVNGSSLVAEEKRAKIQAIIDEMGYEPAPIEKRKGVRKDPWPWIKYGIFKVVLFGPHDLFWVTNYAPVYSYVLHGIEEYLGTLRFQRVIERVESASDLLALLGKGGADGYLILNTGHDPLPAEIEKYPVVTFMGLNEHLRCDRVEPDPDRAGILAAEYIYSKQCAVGISIGGPGVMYGKRAAAFSGWLKNRGVETVETFDEMIVHGGPRMHQANREVIANRLLPILVKFKQPIGLFSVADIITPMLYSALAEIGLKVGKDVYVVSCNNERPLLDALYPAPAVIDIRAEFIGRRAVQQVMRRLEVPNDPRETIRVEPSLILPEEP